MCQSMVNIQSPTAEIRRGKKRKKEERKKKERRKKQDENIMVCPITYGDHKKTAKRGKTKPKPKPTLSRK